MKKIVPISLIWLTVLLAILTLTSKLGFLWTRYHLILLALTGISFLTSIFCCRVSFLSASRMVSCGIEHWDSTMRRDIGPFIKVRKLRMTWLFAMMLILYVIAFYTQLDNNRPMSEIVLYVLVIGFFHCALVTTLVMFKMFRTLSWVEHENLLAESEVN